MTRGQITAIGAGAREPGAGPVVEGQDVSHVFTRGGVTVTAVRLVSCAVWAGDRVALTGPSGSGKSTLLHLLAGLVRPTAGTVSWPPDGWQPGRIGVVFQGQSLMPDLAAVENVALPLLLAGTTESDALATARAALDLLAIGDLAATLPETLSAGQAQRVAIARVLAGRPRLILADEPTGRLDHDTGAQVVSVLLDTATAVGAGLVVATHDPQVAARLDTRWHMRDGQLSEEDPA